MPDSRFCIVHASFWNRARARAIRLRRVLSVLPHAPTNTRPSTNPTASNRDSIVAGVGSNAVHVDGDLSQLDRESAIQHLYDRIVGGELVTDFKSMRRDCLPFVDKHLGGYEQVIRSWHPKELQDDRVLAIVAAGN